MQPILIVGLDKAEIFALHLRLGCPTLVFDSLPRVRVDGLSLLVEHPHFMNLFVPVSRVIYHAIFEDDADFLAAMALWGGPCLPGARGMMDLRRRLPGLVRALAVTRFGGIRRGYADRAATVAVESSTVAKWGNWHCGEDKARFDGAWTAQVPTLFEEFIAGDAVRVVLIGAHSWQVRMGGEGWLKSIHNPDSSFMDPDPELLTDARALADHFGLATVGVDYMIGLDGTRYLLEVNHIPNVTVFAEVRAAYLDLVVQWSSEATSS